MADVARIGVLLIGGFIVGLGVPIMWAYGRLWARLGYTATARAGYLLLLVNALVLAFLAFALVDRYGQPVSWRLPLALVIFALKGWMLWSFRSATHEHADALARRGVIDRRAPVRDRRS